MNPQNSAAIDRLAEAISSWLAGDRYAAARIRDALQLLGLKRVRATLKATRARFSFWGTPRATPRDVGEALKHTAAELGDWCLLGCMAHPDGYVREAAAALLPLHATSASCAAAMFAADDHVEAVRRMGRRGLRTCTLRQLVERADRIAERWNDPGRRSWRTATKQRLGAPDARAVLFESASTRDGVAAEAALDLLDQLHGVQADDAETLAGAAEWRVRRRIAELAIEREWLDVARIAAQDSRRLVRTALVMSAARHPGPFRDLLMRELAFDSSPKVRRVAAFYCKGDEALLARCRAELGEGGSVRRLALATAVVLDPSAARATASRLLRSSVPADRRAALEALGDMGGPTQEQLTLLTGEPNPSVRRAAFSVLDRTHSALAARSMLLRAWALLDGARFPPPATGSLLAAAPAVLRGLSAGESWARQVAGRVEQALRGAAVEAWRVPDEPLVDALSQALREVGVQVEEGAPRLVRAARNFVASHGQDRSQAHCGDGNR